MRKNTVRQGLLFPYCRQIHQHFGYQTSPKEIEQDCRFPFTFGRLFGAIMLVIVQKIEKAHPSRTLGLLPLNTVIP